MTRLSDLGTPETILRSLFTVLTLIFYVASAANWRDTFHVAAAPEPLNPKDLPQTLRVLNTICHTHFRLNSTMIHS